MPAGLRRQQLAGARYRDIVAYGEHHQLMPLAHA